MKKERLLRNSDGKVMMSRCFKPRANRSHEKCWPQRNSSLGHGYKLKVTVIKFMTKKEEERVGGVIK